MTTHNLVEQFQDILDAQVESGEECGCQLAIFRDGVPVANIAAGWTDPSRTRKVTPDSLFPVFSCGKGILSTAFHMLYEREFFFGLPREEERRAVPIDGSTLKRDEDQRLKINTCEPVRRW